MKTILIVEDNELNMKLFSDLLCAHGFKTLLSTDGVDTLQLAREHHPDLILMDIKLPKTSGLEHTKALKADDDLKYIPVLAITAFAMKGDEKKLLEAGCDGYISKPINISDFLGTIRRFLSVGRFKFTKALQIGHPQIDAEHEQLIVLVNESLDLLDVDDVKGCAGKIREITVAFKSHINHEEEIMERLGYYHLDEHKKEHQTAINKYSALIDDAERNDYGGNFANQLISLFADFIVRIDMGFKMYLEGMDDLPLAPIEKTSA